MPERLPRLASPIHFALCAAGVVACGRSELVAPWDSNNEDCAAPIDASTDTEASDASIDSVAIETDSGYSWPDTTVADVARDHAIDAACASGRWSFGPIVTYAAPTFAGDSNGGPVLGAGDFDGDGTLDLIGLYSAPSSAAIWSNLGDGTMALRTTFAITGGAYVVAVGDFNRDGRADFATGFVADVNIAGANLDGVEVFTNQGDGTFAMTSTFAVDGGALDIVVGDFNGDGAPDIAVGDDFEALNVALNRGDGVFPSVVTYETYYLVDKMAVGDVNHDGALDIVSTSAAFDSPRVGVFLNNGDGTFGQPTSYAGICDDTGSVALGDFNGDGWLDVARTCWQGGDSVAVRLNNGDGTFGSETGYQVGTWPSAVTVDRFFSTSGPVDIAAAPIMGSYYSGDHGIAVLPGNGDGTFGEEIGVGSLGSHVLVAGDFSGDGHPDIAFATGNAFGVLFFVCE
jgi:hypothetical protein